MNLRRFTWLLLLASTASAASAAEFGHTQVRFEPATFETQRSALEREVRSSNRYAEMASADRRTVLQALEVLGDILRPVQSLDQLNPNAKIHAFNLQEQINTLLTGAAADSRVICKRETPVGTRRPINICRTVAEKRRERDQAETTFGRMAPPPRASD